FPELLKLSQQIAVHTEQTQKRSRRLQRADRARLTTPSGTPPVFFVQLQQRARLSAFQAPSDSRTPQCKDLRRRGGDRGLLRTRQVRAEVAAIRRILPNLLPHVWREECGRRRHNS